MSARATTLLVLAAGIFAAGCKESATIPHTPTRLIIVSGGNQSGDIGNTALAQPLVVQAQDGAGKPVSGVPVTWAVTGGGSITPIAATTDNSGDASATWTLASSVGTQVATATSAQVAGVAVSFVATNGATITGTVTSAVGQPFATAFSRAKTNTAAMPRTCDSSAASPPTGIIVGLQDPRARRAAAGSATLSIDDDARGTMSGLDERRGADQVAPGTRPSADLARAARGADERRRSGAGRSGDGGAAVRLERVLRGAGRNRLDSRRRAAPDGRQRHGAGEAVGDATDAVGRDQNCPTTPTSSCSCGWPTWSTCRARGRSRRAVRT